MGTKMQLKWVLNKKGVQFLFIKKSLKALKKLA